MWNGYAVMFTSFIQNQTFSTNGFIEQLPKRYLSLLFSFNDYLYVSFSIHDLVINQEVWDSIDVLVSSGCYFSKLLIFLEVDVTPISTVLLAFIFMSVSITDSGAGAKAKQSASFAGIQNTMLSEVHILASVLGPVVTFHFSSL